MSDYVVDFKIRNGRIKAAMRSAGFENQAALARAAGVEPNAVCALLNLKLSPTTRVGEWRSVVLKIADALKLTPEDLFSESQKQVAISNNSGEIFVTEKQARRIAERGFADVLRLTAAETNPEKLLISDLPWDEGLVSKLLDRLTPRKAKVIQMRFGLPPFDRTYTLEEVGRELDVDRERARQIEAGALRQMQSHARLLNQYISPRKTTVELEPEELRGLEYQPLGHTLATNWVVTRADGSDASRPELTETAAKVHQRLLEALYPHDTFTIAQRVPE